MEQGSMWLKSCSSGTKAFLLLSIHISKCCCGDQEPGLSSAINLAINLIPFFFSQLEKITFPPHLSLLTTH